ncbi:type II toxin-antitoxin system RelE/ParE family toxin [Crocosphaera sp. XPORK-15E]|uniref:type II toxin-antitoxin system RelE/ParE family toxin n=1 Tax=Crocosphaera sp. XPORK-15E TaxID=3110247 RepID=UPI002B216C6E|nr:type II toxin-antitoxin system RelE/ParE family toxin [Crocosphaera sp. XPORK-15E]MEA5532901.1 type II toxin-antitoxin system RelE/ParE family toxin [Crocosphaera sp. XPORK-15E]
MFEFSINFQSSILIIIGVRVQFGNNIFRLLGFFVENNVLILTNGFTKKTQKTPSQEINLAHQRKRDYLNRRLNDE